MTVLNDIRVLIVAEHASLKFGGEAALPLHYFRVLRNRGIETWLIVHNRTRHELETLFPEDIARMHFVVDTVWHRLLWRIGKLFPDRLSYFTFGLALRLITQMTQRRIAKQITEEHQIHVIHQPIPVSPKDPSMMFGFDVPVIIGPMNGGMNYPPAFREMESVVTRVTVNLGRAFANIVNQLIPGKLHAATLLVANQRTKTALPSIVQATANIVKIVENGVDLQTWQMSSQDTDKDSSDYNTASQSATRFVFMGRLVDWKSVNLLLDAFKVVVEHVPAELEIIGDGPERVQLESQANKLGLLSLSETNHNQTKTHHTGSVHFSGWLAQAECAEKLKNADVFVLPSLLECGGAVVLEAMALKLPVIATNWGGPTDYIDDSCGILVDPTSKELFVSGLTNAMISLAKNPEQRISMGEHAYDRVVQLFDWEAKVNSILSIYQEAVIERSEELVTATS